MLCNREEEISKLIGEFLEGKESAFEEIIRLAAQDVVNIAYHYLCDEQEAKDISQEVFLKLYKRLKSFSGEAKFSTWVYRITANTSIDFLRRKKKIVSWDKVMVGAQTKDRIIESVEKMESEVVIKSSIEKLPLRQKNVLILKHFEGLKISEISKVLNCSESSVKTHLYRAIESLRKELSGKVILRI